MLGHRQFQARINILTQINTFLNMRVETKHLYYTYEYLCRPRTPSNSSFVVRFSFTRLCCHHYCYQCNQATRNIVGQCIKTQENFHQISCQIKKRDKNGSSVQEDRPMEYRVKYCIGKNLPLPFILFCRCLKIDGKISANSDDKSQ